MRYTSKDIQQFPQTWDKATVKATAKGFNPYDNSSALRSQFSKEMDTLDINLYSEYLANVEQAA